MTALIYQLAIGDNIPAPLLPPEVDLSDFSFMPLYVRRLRDSKLAASVTGEEFRAAVLLWCASWHQKPAASLPDDDIELSQFAGFGRVVSEWEKVKAGALRGWIKCSDGRLYHPVVAETAVEAWNGKLDHAWDRECDRIRKENKRREKVGKAPLEMPPKPTPVSVRMVDGTLAEIRRTSDGIPSENALKGQGQGQGQGQGDFIMVDEVDRQFEIFWQTYPSRQPHSNPRKTAHAKFKAATKSGVDPAAIVEGASRYAAYVAARVADSKFIAQAATWISQERWNDQHDGGDLHHSQKSRAAI